MPASEPGAVPWRAPAGAARPAPRNRKPARPPPSASRDAPDPPVPVRPAGGSPPLPVRLPSSAHFPRLTRSGTRRRRRVQSARISIGPWMSGLPAFSPHPPGAVAAGTLRRRAGHIVTRLVQGPGFRRTKAADQWVIGCSMRKGPCLPLREMALAAIFHRCSSRGRQDACGNAETSQMFPHEWTTRKNRRFFRVCGPHGPKDAEGVVDTTLKRLEGVRPATASRLVSAAGHR